MAETGINIIDRKTAFVSTDDAIMIRKIEKLGSEVEIIKSAADNDGCLYCKVPASWIKIVPPRKVNYTDEQREALRQRLQKVRNKA